MTKFHQFPCELNCYVLWRLISLCAGAEWRSLGLFERTLVDQSFSTRTRELVSEICRRGSYTGIENSQKINSLRTSSNEIRLKVSIAFSHLQLARFELMFNNSQPARIHCDTFLLILQSLAMTCGEWWGDDLQRRLEGIGHSLVDKLRAQQELKSSISKGKLSRNLTFVLGMHRSGTSAISGFLCQSFFDAPADLMPASNINSKGFWESQGMFELNDRLLVDLDSSWWDPRPLPWGWVDEKETIDWRDNLLQHLENVFCEASYPLIKDPRFCLLIPALHSWMESENAFFAFVLIFRHPYEVINSLKSAQGTDTKHGIRLWIRSMFQAEKYSRSFPRRIVNYNDLLQNSEDILESCTSLWPELTNKANNSQTLCDIMGFIDPELYHLQVSSLTHLEYEISSYYSKEVEIALQLYDIFISHQDSCLLDSESELTVLADKLYSQWILL